MQSRKNRDTNIDGDFRRQVGALKEIVYNDMLVIFNAQYTEEEFTLVVNTRLKQFNVDIETQISKSFAKIQNFENRLPELLTKPTLDLLFSICAVYGLDELAATMIGRQDIIFDWILELLYKIEANKEKIIATSVETDNAAISSQQRFDAIITSKCNAMAASLYQIIEKSLLKEVDGKRVASISPEVFIGTIFKAYKPKYPSVLEKILVLIKNNPYFEDYKRNIYSVVINHLITDYNKKKQTRKNTDLSFSPTFEPLMFIRPLVNVFGVQSYSETPDQRITLLHLAIYLELKDIFDFLLPFYVKENLLELSCVIDTDKYNIDSLTMEAGGTFLHIAAEKSNPYMVTELLKNGADVNALTHYHQSPLNHSANIVSNLDRALVVRLLIDNGADATLTGLLYKSTSYDLLNGVNLKNKDQQEVNDEVKMILLEAQNYPNMQSLIQKGKAAIVETIDKVESIIQSANENTLSEEEIKKNIITEIKNLDNFLCSGYKEFKNKKNSFLQALYALDNTSKEFKEFQETLDYNEFFDSKTFYLAKKNAQVSTENSQQYKSQSKDCSPYFIEIIPFCISYGLLNTIEVLLVDEIHFVYLMQLIFQLYEDIHADDKPLGHMITGENIHNKKLIQVANEEIFSENRALYKKLLENLSARLTASEVDTIYFQHVIFESFSAVQSKVIIDIIKLTKNLTDQSYFKAINNLIYGLLHNKINNDEVSNEEKIVVKKFISYAFHKSIDNDVESKIYYYNTLNSYVSIFDFTILNNLDYIFKLALKKVINIDADIIYKDGVTKPIFVTVENHNIEIFYHLIKRYITSQERYEELFFLFSRKTENLPILIVMLALNDNFSEDKISDFKKSLTVKEKKRDYKYLLDAIDNRKMIRFIYGTINDEKKIFTTLEVISNFVEKKAQFNLDENGIIVQKKFMTLGRWGKLPGYCPDELVFAVTDLKEIIAECRKIKNENELDAHKIIFEYVLSQYRTPKTLALRTPPASPSSIMSSASMLLKTPITSPLSSPAVRRDSLEITQLPPTINTEEKASNNTNTSGRTIVSLPAPTTKNLKRAKSDDAYEKVIALQIARDARKLEKEKAERQRKEAERAVREEKEREKKARTQARKAKKAEEAAKAAIDVPMTPKTSKIKIAKITEEKTTETVVSESTISTTSKKPLNVNAKVFMPIGELKIEAKNSDPNNLDKTKDVELFNPDPSATFTSADNDELDTDLILDSISDNIHPSLLSTQGFFSPNNLQREVEATRNVKLASIQLKSKL